MNTKGQKGFAIFNIAIGVVVTMAGFISLSDPSVSPYNIIFIIIGAITWMCGANVLRKLKRVQEGEDINIKMTLTMNKILFVASCLITLCSLTLPFM